jgi:hypothetical protein
MGWLKWRRSRAPEAQESRHASASSEIHREGAGGEDQVDESVVIPTLKQLKRKAAPLPDPAKVRVSNRLRVPVDVGEQKRVVDVGRDLARKDEDGEGAETDVHATETSSSKGVIRSITLDSQHRLRPLEIPPEIRAPHGFDH